MNKVFLDINILIYAQDNREPARRDQARLLLWQIKEQCSLGRDLDAGSPGVL